MSDLGYEKEYFSAIFYVKKFFLIEFFFFRDKKTKKDLQKYEKAGMVFPYFSV